MPPSTPARLKQSRLPFAAVPPPAQPGPARPASSKYTASDMKTLADEGFSDGPATPAKRSKVIYTPNKTHTVQDGLSHLPSQRKHTKVASTVTSGNYPVRREEVEDDDDDDDVILRRKRRPAQLRGRLSSLSRGTGDRGEGEEGVGEDEDDIVLQRKRRRVQPRGSSSSPSRGRAGRGEGEEEGKDDQDAEGASAGPRTRNRVGAVKPKMTRKQKLLEELKNRRAGLSSAKGATLSPPPETLGVLKRGIYDTDTENEPVFPDDEDDDSLAIEAIRKSLRGGRDKGYDTDFVVSDDDGNIGAPSFGPGRLDLPIEFTLRAHKRLSEHFSDAIEWMIHNKLNPAFNRNSPVYRVAFQRLDSEAATYSSSKFESSAWTQDFKRSLKARPEFHKQPTSSRDEGCEACNRKNHPASYTVRFGGKPYDCESLEEISSFSEDDDDPGSEYDNQGNTLPDAAKAYSVGRVCCLNAETAHTLTHWRYHLNQWVVDELHRRGLFDANAILNRESWNRKKRSVYADSIVHQFQESGETSRLYDDFKNNLNEARDAKPNRWRNHVSSSL